MTLIADELIEAAAMALVIATVCGCTLDDKRVFCDDQRLDDFVRKQDCECKIGTRAALETALPLIVEALMPHKPADNPKDGPCCYELEDCDGIRLWIGQGCSCGNYDDAQNAASWAKEMNSYLRAEAKLRALGINIQTITCGVKEG